MEEHDAFGHLSDALGTSGPTVLLGWVDGTLAHILRGANAIIFPSQRRVFYEHGGGIFLTAQPNMASVETN